MFKRRLSQRLTVKTLYFNVKFNILRYQNYVKNVLLTTVLTVGYIHSVQLEVIN